MKRSPNLWGGKKGRLQGFVSAFLGEDPKAELPRGERDKGERGETPKIGLKIAKERGFQDVSFGHRRKTKEMKRKVSSPRRGEEH